MAKLVKSGKEVAPVLEDEIDREEALSDEIDLEDSEVELEDEGDLEESAAADTLHPNSMPPGKANKSWAAGRIIDAFAGMDQETINKFVETMDQIGKEARNIPGSDAAKNKASIAAKPSLATSESIDEGMSKIIREDVTAMFEGEDLTEEFKERVAVLIESAVNMKESKRALELEEAYEAALEEEIDHIVGDVAETLDRYLDEVVEEWMASNEVAIESTLRSDLTEDFIESLRALFETHYVAVPEDRVDLIDELGTRVEELEAAWSEVLDENDELKATIETMKAEEALADMSEGLVGTDAERLRELAESVEFSDVEEFTAKVSVLREQYFGEETVSSPAGDKARNLFEETELVESEEEVPVRGPMNQYVSAIGRTVRK